MRQGRDGPEVCERPVLVTVPRSGRSVDPAALRQHFRGRFPNWWVPDLVLVVDELPHGPSGKIQKQALRER